MAYLSPALFVLALVSIIHGKEMKCYQCMDSSVLNIGDVLKNTSLGNMATNMMDMPVVKYSAKCSDPFQLGTTDSSFITSKCQGNCVKREYLGSIYRYCDNSKKLTKTMCKDVLDRVKSDCYFVCSTADLCNSQIRVGYSASLLAVIMAFVVLRA